MAIGTVLRRKISLRFPKRSVPLILCGLLVFGFMADTSAQEAFDNETASQKIIAEIRRVGAISTQQAQKIREQRSNDLPSSKAANVAGSQKGLDGLSELFEKQQQLEQNFGESLLAKADALESRLNYLLLVLSVAFFLVLIAFALLMARLLKNQNLSATSAGMVVTPTEDEPVLHAAEQDMANRVESDTAAKEGRDFPVPFSGIEHPPEGGANQAKSQTSSTKNARAGGIPRAEYGDVLSRMLLKNQAEFMSR